MPKKPLQTNEESHIVKNRTPSLGSFFMPVYKYPKRPMKKRYQDFKKRKPHLYKEHWLTEGYKKPDHVKMIKQIRRHKEKNIRIGPDTSLFDPKYRNDSRNRAFKMHNIRGALKRGEDPRRDTVAGRQKTPIDRRKEYTYNQKDRPAKKPGVQKEAFVYERYVDLGSKNNKGINRNINMSKRAEKRLDSAILRGDKDKVNELKYKKTKTDRVVDDWRSDPAKFRQERMKKSIKNQNLGKSKRMMG